MKESNITLLNLSSITPFILVVLVSLACTFAPLDNKESTQLEPTLTSAPQATDNLGSPTVYYEQGLAHKNSGDLEAAIADFTTAIDLNPEYALVHRPC